MTIPYKPLWLSILCWPILPIAGIVLYDALDIRMTEFWQSLLFYLVFLIPAQAFFFMYRRTLYTVSAPIPVKFAVVVQAIILTLSTLAIIFAILAPRGWD